MPLRHYDVLDLGTLGGAWVDTVALNNYGQIVGHSDTLRSRDGEVVKEAYLWDRGRMASLGEIRVTAINNQGWVAGYQGGTQALLQGVAGAVVLHD